MAAAESTEHQTAKSILVTGSGGSIGGAVAEHLERQGHRVVRLSHTRRPNADLVADFTNDQELTQAVASWAGPLHGMVLCHGYAGPPSSLEEIDPAEFRRIYDVNVVSIYNIIR